MADRGIGKARLQAVQDRLVGDLARQPHIARRDPRDRRAHQRAAPMRRRAGQMGDASACQARQEIGHRLASAPTIPARRRRAARAGRSASRHSGGCRRMCPRRRGLRSPRRLIAPVSASSVCTTIFGAPVVPEVNITHSLARVAGPRGSGLRSLEIATSRNPPIASPSVTSVSIPARWITFPEMFVSQIGRRDHDPAGDAIQCDQCRCRRDLTPRTKQHVRAVQRIQQDGKRVARDKRAKFQNGAARALKPPRRRAGAGPQIKRRHLHRISRIRPT